MIVAHAWWNGEKGPFRRLGGLELGAPIEVRGSNGELHTYEVVERTMYDKDKLPSHLWRTTGPETLVLITCGGKLDSDTRRYEQNIVVYATATQPVSGVAS
ncbi:MAG: class F sortase [Acidimicrobiia bacterium]